jgi:hypothetical protein
VSFGILLLLFHELALTQKLGEQAESNGQADARRLAASKKIQKTSKSDDGRSGRRKRGFAGASA